MTEENGPDDASGPPEGEEEQVEETRRVRPLFRFGRKAPKEEPAKEGPEDERDEAVDEEGSRGPVRPVRVVKFIPPGEEMAEEAQFTENVEEDGGEAPFIVEEEAPFIEEEEVPFQVEEEPAQFVEEGEAPFAELVEEAPFFEEEASVSEEAPFVVDEQVPESSYEDLEETRWEEPVHDSLGVQEEAETGGEFEFRSEETPATFEASEEQTPEVPGPAGNETKPHYHKYLKPDEDLVSSHPAKGPATGFDRDMDADAGEIDFGIDLIDPSERRKKRKKPPRKDDSAAPKKGVGGHDSDAEVDSRGTGAEVGVDYQKRRKRRL